MIPFAINCYGSNLLHAQGGTAALFMPARDPSTLPDPPSPHRGAAWRSAKRLPRPLRLRRGGWR